MDRFPAADAAAIDAGVPVARRYGDGGAWLTLLHGGPGAPGHLAPVARTLAAQLRILEPFERRSGATPLSVALHVRDIDDAIRRHAGAQPTALLGFSSGAITALAYAAAHSEHVSQLVLVAPATLDPRSREQFRMAFDARLSDTARAELQRARTIGGDTERLRVQLAAMAPAYFVDPITTDTEDVWYLLQMLLTLLAMNGVAPDAADPWRGWMTFKQYARVIDDVPDPGVSVLSCCVTAAARPAWYFFGRCSRRTATTTTGWSPSAEW